MFPSSKTLLQEFKVVSFLQLLNQKRLDLLPLHVVDKSPESVLLQLVDLLGSNDVEAEPAHNTSLPMVLQSLNTTLFHSKLSFPSETSQRYGYFFVYLQVFNKYCGLYNQQNTSSPSTLQAGL